MHQKGNYLICSDAYSCYGEFNTAGKLFVADVSKETGVVLFGVSRRLDSSQKCPRVEDFQASCPFEDCQQCDGSAVMLYQVSIDGTITVIGHQLHTIMPAVDSLRVRSERYGKFDFAEFDRTRVEHGYGNF